MVICIKSSQEGDGCALYDHGTMFLLVSFVLCFERLAGPEL